MLQRDHDIGDEAWAPITVLRIQPDRPRVATRA